MIIITKIALVFMCFLQGFVAGKHQQKNGTFSIWFLILGIILGLTAACL